MAAFVILKNMRTGQNTAALVFAMIMAAAPGCSDSILYEGDNGHTGIITSNDADPAAILADSLDIEIDPCVDVNDSSHASWCSCQPQCCIAQAWFCPPKLGDPTVYSKEVIVDICDGDHKSCVYKLDADCPPPEIVLESECFPAYECPPATNLDYGWQYCELPNGSIGKQQVICDKGQLYYSACQDCTPEVCDGENNDCDDQVDEDVGILDCETECGIGVAVCVDGEELCFGSEPSEEICDGVDNDCDGATDEFQLNACSTCGPVPQEVCNGVDDDCDDQVDEGLTQACSSDCGVGVEMCYNGLWHGCTAQQPAPEVCDGVDNDCDQLIDEGIECLCTLGDVGVLSPCAEAPLLCGQGFKTCECLDPACQQLSISNCYAICYWLSTPPGTDQACEHLIGLELEKEECNNFDDNCNQQIDEGLISACYTGPPETLFIGTCEPGVMTCSLGVWGSIGDQSAFIPGYCVDESVPQDEICDGIDNNCDGEIDWGEELPDTDILFIVDWSGSMVDEIDATLIALNQFATNYADQSAIRWGLMVGPRKLVYLENESLYVISDISPFQIFLSDFMALGDDGMSTGSEMLLDAIYLALQNVSSAVAIDLQSAYWENGIGSIPALGELNLSWRDGAERVIIVFTDENEQSYMVPKVTAAEVMTSCQAAPQTKVYTFSTNEFWKWDEIAINCGGQYFNLTSDAVSMYNSLMEILDEICAGN